MNNQGLLIIGIVAFSIVLKDYIEYRKGVKNSKKKN